MGMNGRTWCPHRVQRLLLVSALVLTACSPTLAADPEPTPAPYEDITVEPTPSATPEPERDVCAELREAVPAIHEDPFDVTLPEPLEVVYETEPDPEFGEYERHPYGALGGPTIQVWVDFHPSTEAVVFTILHELGHVYDHLCMTSPDRLRWMRARDLGSHVREWATGDYWTMPSEDFADAWAVCMQADPGEWRTAAAPPPSEEECRLIP